MPNNNQSLDVISKRLPKQLETLKYHSNGIANSVDALATTLELVHQVMSFQEIAIIKLSAEVEALKYRLIVHEDTFNAHEEPE